MMSPRLQIFFLFTVMCCCALCAQEPIKVACVGNSITYGAGIADQVNDSYPAQLQKLLGDGYAVLNCGNSGRTMLKHGDYPLWVEPQFKAAIEMAPDVVVILLGTNDSKPYNWIYKHEFIPDYIAMIDTFRTVNLDVQIYACLPPPAFAVQWDIRDSVITADIIPMILQIADSMQVETIDFYQPLVDSNALFPDNIHPNAEGAWEMAKIVYNAMTGKSVAEMQDADVARGKKVVDLVATVSYPPEYLVDGDASTSWNTVIGGSAVIDLGIVESVDLFIVDFGVKNDTIMYPYVIQVSRDSLTWSQVVDRSDLAGKPYSRLLIDAKDPVDARYIKLAATASGATVAIGLDVSDFRVMRTAPVHAPVLYIDDIDLGSAFTRYKYYVLPTSEKGYLKVVRSTDVGEPFTDVKGYRISAAQNSSASIRPDRLQRYYTVAYYDGIEVLSADTLTVDWSISAVESEGHSMLPDYTVENYPNPFNGMTIVRFQLPEKRHVVIDVYNLRGQRIETLLDAEVGAGHHSAVWRAANQPSGIYLCHFAAGDLTRTSRMILLK